MIVANALQAKIERSEKNLSNCTTDLEFRNKKLPELQQEATEAAAAYGAIHDKMARTEAKHGKDNRKYEALLIELDKVLNRHIFLPIFCSFVCIYARLIYTL